MSLADDAPVFLIERALSALLVLWLAATLIFFALRVLPGDALAAQLAQGGATTAQIDAARAQLGLDDHLLAQYGRFLGGLLRGSLGVSLSSGRPVEDMIAERLWPTIELALLAVLLAALGGLALGVLSAADRWAGRMARLLVGLALGVPIYWTATLAVVLFAVTLGWLPSSGTGSWRQLVLPVSVLAFHTLGAIARLTQISVREVRAMLFVRTAHGKGLPAGLVLRRHVLRVALPPAVTVIALQTGFLLGGAVIIESVFVRPGIGRLLLDSTLRQDYPVVQGVVVLTATAYVALNTLADIVHRLLDPRLRA